MNTDPPASPTTEALTHGMNCAGLVGGSDEATECTCGLRFRIALQTEQTMHAAWRKRAEEAEKELAAAREQIELARDWRRTLNKICELVGHPPISPQEGHTESIAESVAALSRYTAIVDERLEAVTPDHLQAVSASLEHHEEHHATETTLREEIVAKDAEIAAMREGLRPFAEAATDFDRGRKDTEVVTRVFWAGAEKYVITLGDLRRAAALLGRA